MRLKYTPETRQKEQRLFGRNLVSLEGIFLKADHITLLPFWPNRPSNPDIEATIHMEIRRLPRKEKQVITLRHLRHLIWYDVAERTGYSRQWCKRLEHRAFEFLRRSAAMQRLILRLQEAGRELN